MDLVNTMHQLLSAPGRLIPYQMLRSQPELMSETALDHLASLQDKARAEKNAALVERCSHWAGVLRECAKRGPGIVFWGRPLTDGEAVLVSVPPDIQQQLLQVCAWSSRTELPQKITQLRTLIASLAPAGPPGCRAAR